MSSSEATDFESYSKDVYGWAYRLLGRHHDALDVVQDVFLKWSRQCVVEMPRQPRGWLRRTTLNHAIDLRRRRHARAMNQPTTTVHEINRDPEAAGLDQETLRGDIAAAFERLTEVQRSVLVAKVYDDMTFARIAAELDLAVPTVKTHYLRAVQTMRDRLRSRWA